MPAHARSSLRSRGSSIGTSATAANTSLSRSRLRSPLNSISLGGVDRALPADRRLARLLTGNKWRESEEENLDGSQGEDSAHVCDRCSSRGSGGRRPPFSEPRSLDGGDASSGW